MLIREEIIIIFVANWEREEKIAAREIFFSCLDEPGSYIAFFARTYYGFHLCNYHLLYQLNLLLLLTENPDFFFFLQANIDSAKYGSWT